MIFDTHAHYDDEAFDEDRDNLLTSMKDNGVGRIVNVGANMSGSKASVMLANQYKDVYAAVGVHPSDVEEMNEASLEILRKYFEDEKVLAIGEIGLDYYYPEPDKEIQKIWFRKQLDLAAELDKPIIIHSRDAAKDTMDILKEYEGKLTGVIHCYSYSLEMAKQYIDMGYYIGIGGVLTFKNARKTVEVVEGIPLERIVLETDSPYLAPVPNRGKRNDSTNIKYVVEKISEIKGISKEIILNTTYNNAVNLYRMNRG